MLVQASWAAALSAAVLIAGRCTNADGQVAAAPPAAVQPPAPRAMRPLPADASLYGASNSPLTEPETRVIADAAGWAAAWAQLHAGLAVGPPPPVDFTQARVVLVAIGERTSGGHAVRVEGVSDGPAGGLTVHVVRTAPGPGCMSTMVMTAPAAAVRVPRPAGGVRVQTRDEAAPC